jgi:hypothetical protein
MAITRRLKVPALILAACCLGLAIAGTEKGLSIKDLVAFVRAAIQRHTPDHALAKSLSKFALTERLDSATVEELESEGAGPESADALARLQQLSAGQPRAADIPSLPIPPPPSAEEQKKSFRAILRNALQYTASLPDFICTEVIRRYTAPLSAHEKTAWKPDNTLTVELTYFENHEKYKPILLNGRQTSRSYESFGGQITRGDFGTELLSTFRPDAGTEFHWDRWSRLRKRLIQVYSYRVDSLHSHDGLSWGTGNNQKTINVGRHGFVYADNATHMVVRITGEADDIMPESPPTAQSSILDYDFVSIEGRQFLVPVRAERQLKSRSRQFRNVEDFRNYRKFASSTTLSFGDPTPDPAQSPQSPGAK